MSMRWGAWCGLAAAVAAFAGVVALILFYLIQVPHLHGGHAWGTDPQASLGYANDLLGIVSMALLLPFVVALWTGLPLRSSTPDRAVLALGLVAAGAIVLSGLGLVTHVLSLAISSGISGVGSVLLAAWIGLFSLRAPGRVLSKGQMRLGKTIGAAVLISAVLVGGSFLLPRFHGVLIVTAVLALPGLIGYLGIPVWIGWVALGIRHLSQSTAPVATR